MGDRAACYDLTKNFPDVLLMGNGVLQSCRSMDGIKRPSWAECIERLANGEMTEKKRKMLADIPYSVQAAIAASVKDGERRQKYEDCFAPLKNIDNTLLKELMACRFDAILTTNYTYEIEDAFFAGYSVLKEKRRYAVSYAADPKYLLHTCNQFENRPPVWHIHGELRRKSSIVMTHDEYVRLLQKIVEYNKAIARKYLLFSEKVYYDSWVDYFLMSNLYVVGLGMDFSEIDLWWLINRRLREKAKTGKIIFYKSMYDDSAVSNALQLMEVEVVAPDIDAESKEEYYRIFYRNVIEDIQKRQGERL